MLPCTSYFSSKASVDEVCALTLATPLPEAQLASEEFHMETSLSLIPWVPAGQTILCKDNNKSSHEH